MRTKATLAALLLLAGCDGAYDAMEYRKLAVGHISKADFIACAGVPDKTMVLSSDEEVLMRSIPAAAAPTLSVTLPVLGAAVVIGNNGPCNVVARVRGNRVIAIHYEGAQLSLEGAHAACGPVVSDCLRDMKEDIHVDEDRGVPVPIGGVVDGPPAASRSGSPARNDGGK